ncbi:MAG: 5-histidylcysteine sulfoxide synthase [Bacteroidales bacterium]
METPTSQILTKTVLLNRGDAEEKRQEILGYFHSTFDLYEKLNETLKSEESFYLGADPLRHPLIFYLGHTAVFYINKLILARLIDQRINPRFESIFAVGVDEMSWDDLNESNYNWPAVDQVWTYRAEVRVVVDRLIRTLPLKMPIGWDHPWWTIMMCIEHERIHLETSTMLIRQLPLDQVVQHPFWKPCDLSGDAPQNELIGVPGGEVRLGRSRNTGIYGWDNEFGKLIEEVEDYRASKFLVSNGEFREFVENEGYEIKEYWTEEGWDWRNFKAAAHPQFWRWQQDGTWKLRTMLQEIPMPWNWPVEVNYLEAKAFCNWKSKMTGTPFRLPTEAEWMHLRNMHEVPDQPFWNEAPGNLNLEHFASPAPVDRFAFNGFFDVIGNVWQWTETPIFGFPGFEVHPLYDDFSTPTFDTKHNLIMGGSWISTGNEATKGARYAFRRHFLQYAGFRYLQTEAPVKTRLDVYETDALVSQYCELHYGEKYFGVELFPKKSAEICLKYMEGRSKKRALDLGCAVGRTTFELAREFDHVTGLDFSARFIRIADELINKGTVKFILPDEGELVSYREASLEKLGLEGLKKKVEFYQADAVNLKPQYDHYDLVYAGNLVDRLYDPAKFLDHIHQRINSGGLLILSSPYTWDEEYTKKEKWIGGFKEDGEPVTTLNGLHRHLDTNFRLIAGPFEVPFVIRETKRKHQHTLSEFTVWERR